MFKTEFSNSIRIRQQAGYIPVVPDIKCKSPKEGDLLRGRDPVATARLLVDEGAPVLSVVTESENFGGSLELLEQVIRETGVPVLRKDFISRREDLIVTRDIGASAILLISSMLNQEQLEYLYEAAIELGLEPLVETHSIAEIQYAAKLGAGLVGINNRNIIELERDDGTVEATASLAAYKPEGCVLISESAIATQADANSAVLAGADAVLVGTSLWQAEDMLTLYAELSQRKS
ncbi:MAG: indole-3-glycerol-phosphate synthase [Eubacteriales bacterium]|nr:indole-3-glycerol-phosphate synthase [Eubacteriales bacterium]